MTHLPSKAPPSSSNLSPNLLECRSRSGVTQADPRSPNLGDWVTANGHQLLNRIRYQMSSRACNAMEAEDVLQESMIVVLERLNQFELMAGDVKASWILAIARNVIRNAARRFRLDTSARIAPQLAELEYESNQLPAAEQLDASNRSTKRLWSLTTEAKVAIVAREISRLSWNDIARLLGKSSEDSARKFHARSLQRIRIDEKHGSINAIA